MYDVRENVASGTSAKVRILDTAESLYSSGGVDALSMREITLVANVNQAAINYYFRSKAQLLDAMLVRRLGTLHDERCRQLHKVEEAYAGRLRPLHIVAAILLPVIAHLRSMIHQQQNADFYLRASADASPLIRRVMTSRFGNLASKIDDAFARSMENFLQDDIEWRVRLVVNACAGSIANHNTVVILSKFITEDHLSSAQMIARMAYPIESIHPGVVDYRCLEAVADETVYLLSVDDDTRHHVRA